MRYGIFEAQIEWTRIVLELAEDLVIAGLMVAMDQDKLASGLQLERVLDAFAVGLPKPFLFRELVAALAHLLSGGDPDSRQQRVGQHEFSHACAKIIDGLLIGLLVCNAVLPFGSEGEDIPGDDIYVDSTVLRILHHLPPERDLIVDRHAANRFQVLQQLRAHHVTAVCE